MDGELQPGDILAGRYRMVARIGRGGMGDVWRADDVTLQTAVALKVMRTEHTSARDRLLNEVRLARQITHPAVCRVFDVGESEGRVFYSMELIDGEDLASVLRKVGRVPPERVAEIGRQLCDGLAAAHAQGVLHRDLKPANILMDRSGRVLITDFGIAALQSEASRHTVVGTPGYMAPEQLSSTAPLSVRTDLYALGLVLYELLTGHHPRESSTPSGGPIKPSSVVANVSPEVERTILQAIAWNPAERPESATAMAEGLGGQVATVRRAWPRWVIPAAAIALIAIIAATVLLIRSRGPAIGAQDTIVLADFENTTGDPVFDGTLKVALSVALDQSPYLKVMSEDRVRDTLRLMQRRRDEPITRALAREIAEREHLKALIAGSIAALGSHYVIALEVINTEGGDVVAREQVEAENKEAVLNGLGQAATRLREKLGESLASVQRFDTPLPRATTGSLEALHAYALALDNGRMNMTRDIVPQLRRAIELDPDFALAQAMLSGTYTNLGQTALAPQYSRRAFELRDRVSERERFVISWRYYRDAEQSWTKGLDVARTWSATYPRDSQAFNSVGLALLTLGDFDGAVAPLYTAMSLEPRSVAPPENLAVVLTALDRLGEAKDVLAKARTTQRYSIGQAQRAYQIAFLENDAATMTRLLDEARQQPNGSLAGDWEAKIDGVRGRVTVAVAAYQQSAEALRRDRFDEVAAVHIVEGAELEALVGRCDGARRDVAEAQSLSRDNFTLERASRALAVCGRREEAEAIVADLTRRFPEATLTRDLDVPVARAIVALEAGEPKAVLDLLEPVRRYDTASSAEYWPAYLRGRAYLALNDAAHAAAEFQAIIDHRSYHPDRPLYPLARLYRARAAALGGDRAAARQHYEAFLALWADADADLEPLIQARREAAALR